jgi:hypothetical protein
MSEVYDTDDEVEPVVLQHQMSTGMPSQYTDPFAPRKGKTLVWKDVNMTIVRIVGSTEFHCFAEILTLVARILLSIQAGKGDMPERKLLADVWGEVPPHNTTAIMGASGAGYVDVVSRTTRSSD